MSQIRLRAHNYKNKISVAGKQVKLRANIVDPNPPPAGKRPPSGTGPKPVTLVDDGIQWRPIEPKKQLVSPPKPAGKASQVFKQSRPDLSRTTQPVRLQPVTPAHYKQQQAKQATRPIEEDSDVDSDDLENLQYDQDDHMEYGDNDGEEDDGEEDDGEEEEGEPRRRVGPSALESTPESLSKTPKNSGWHMIVDPDKYHSRPLPSGRQAKIDIPEDEDEEEEEEEEEEFEEYEEDEQQQQPQHFGKKTPKSRQPPLSKGRDPEFKDKVADLAELYSLHRMGFEPQTKEYDLQTDSRLISDSIKSGTKQLMKTETVVLGQSLICLAGSGIERGTKYANNWLAHRGSMNRVPDCSGFSWFLDSPDIKQRFEEPLKRIHELYGSKIRDINPFWSLGIIFLGSLFQYADAKQSNGDQQQMLQQQMMQQQMMQQQQQQVRSPNQMTQQQMMQQQMMQQQMMQQQQQQMRAQQVQASEMNLSNADEERRQKLLRMKEAMKNKDQLGVEQKKTTIVEQFSNMPENKVSENLRIQTQTDPDIDVVVDMMKSMNALERRQFSLQIQNGQVPQHRPQPSRTNNSNRTANRFKPPVVTRGVRFDLRQDGEDSEDDESIMDDSEEDDDISQDSDESLPRWNPTTPKRPQSVKSKKPTSIGITPIRTPPF